MGNSLLDLSYFPYSKHSWVPSVQPKTLKCESNSLKAHFAVINKLDQADFNYWKFRSQNKDCLVDTLAIMRSDDMIQNFQRNSSGKKRQASSSYCVLIEKIMYRLTDFGTISYQDGLYILRQGLKSIKILGTIFRNFLIDEEFIGINQSGQCKYWINSNYFKNQVELLSCSESNKWGNKQYNSAYNLITQQQENACVWISSSSLAEDDYCQNCAQAFHYLLSKIQIRMLPSMNIKQQENYYDIKSKNLDFFSSSHKLKLQNIQKFVNTLCLVEKIANNYFMSLPSVNLQKGVQQNKQVKQRCLKKVKSQPSTVFSENTKNVVINKNQNIFFNKKFSLKNKRKQSGLKILYQSNLAKGVFLNQNTMKTTQNEPNFYFANRRNWETKLSKFIQ